MAKLILRFDERQLKECVVGVHPVTIGRAPDNRLVIDNPAVSGRHARVVREGDQYVIEDLKSTNGTFVNDKPIDRRALREGDVVLVGKHSLLFSLEGGDDTVEAQPVEEQVPGIAGTMTLDTLRQKALLENAGQERPPKSPPVIPKTTLPTLPQRIGSVRVISGKSDQSHYSLLAMTTIIGKAGNAQIKTKGWFKPKLSAAIARKADGFTVSSMGATVTLNGRKIGGRQDLRDGDRIEVSGLTLEFRLV